jgi:IucA/IucC family protein
VLPKLRLPQCMSTMTGKNPNPNSRHYLLGRAAGRAALEKLAVTYPHPVKWISQEQTLNDRTTCEADYPIHPNSVPADFWPERQPVFWLPEFEASRDQFRLLQNSTRPLPWYLSGSTSDCYAHIVHPLSVRYFLGRDLKQAKWREPRFLATPMASHRTLLVWSPRSKLPPFTVKTSVDLWIGGLNRNVRLKEIKRSVGISSLFAGISKAELVRQGILLLDDPLGLVHKQTNAGLLARDTPWNLGARDEIVPMFSLLASERVMRPRIVDLIAASRLEPAAWVDKFIFTPLLYQAYFLGMTEGLVGEMHEENILMELRNGVPTKRFWHRDLGGFGIDRDLRRLAGKGFERLPAGVHDRHLGPNIPILHLSLREYLQESMGYAIDQALRKHFDLPSKALTNLYDVRVRELQRLVFSADGIRATGNFEKDLNRYRKRKRPGFVWRLKSLKEAA